MTSFALPGVRARRRRLKPPPPGFWRALALLVWDVLLLGLNAFLLGGNMASGDAAQMAVNVVGVSFGFKSIFRGLKGRVRVLGVPMVAAGTWPRFKRELNRWLDDEETR